jgi:hypothetical protein
MRKRREFTVFRCGQVCHLYTQEEVKRMARDVWDDPGAGFIRFSEIPEDPALLLVGLAHGESIYVAIAMRDARPWEDQADRLGRLLEEAVGAINVLICE